MKKTKTIVACVAVLSLVLSLSSGSAFAGAWTDDFDSEGAGNRPTNWTVSYGTDFDTVVSSAQSVSASNSILLTDDSASGFTSAYRDFTTGANDTTGQLTLETYLEDTTEDVWASVRSGGTVMMEVLLYVDGSIRYRTDTGLVGSGTYTANTWKSLKFTWDNPAGKYHAYYGGSEITPTAGVNFAASGTPSRVVVQNGYGGGTGFASYIDDISVSTYNYWTDNFDTGESSGSRPSKWTVSKYDTDPTGGTSDVLISTAQAASASNSILLNDDSNTTSAEAFRDFNPGSDTTGQLTLNVRCEDLTEDVAVELRNGATGLMKVLFYVDGKISYYTNGNRIGTIAYVEDDWRELKITWDTEAGDDGVYRAYYGGTEITPEAGASFTTSGTPNRVVLANGYGGGTGFDSYIDDVSVIPEPATMTLLLLGLPFALRRRR